MTHPKLEDYGRWKTLNSQIDFNLFDYFYMIQSAKNIHSDLIFAFSELFWPTFVIHEDYVFLKENFSLSKYNGLINRGLNVELWINLLTIDPFFEGDKEISLKSKTLGKKLVQAWSSKLKLDFPDKQFSVDYVCDEDTEDFGVTFYQLKNSQTPKITNND